MRKNIPEFQASEEIASTTDQNSVAVLNVSSLMYDSSE
jgi:hypothetical protein